MADLLINSFVKYLVKMWFFLITIIEIDGNYYQGSYFKAVILIFSFIVDIKKIEFKKSNIKLGE